MKPYTQIANKSVFVFERHSDAIIPWAGARRQSENPLILVTFDKHTDTLAPFLRWGYRKAERLRDFDSQDIFIEERLKALDFQSEECVSQAAEDLWHDEHIRAAMGAGIIKESYVIALNSVSKEQRVPNIHYLPSMCHYGCPKVPHDDDCDRAHSDLVIDDQHLLPLFREIQEIRVMLEGCEPIILDIDLDYFRTINSLSPSSTAVLGSLLDRAACITIAKESTCVEDGRLDDEVTSEWALKTIIPMLERMGEQAAS
ncbi:MAG: UPF0489 family protein [Luteolibacter sp.]